MSYSDFFFLSDKPQGKQQPKLNRPVKVITNVIKNVVASAAEAEVGALFHDLKGVALRAIPEEMGKTLYLQKQTMQWLTA